MGDATNGFRDLVAVGDWREDSRPRTACAAFKEPRLSTKALEAVRNAAAL